MMNSATGLMAEIWRQLQERYPLLERVVVHSLGEENAEAFPLFFGLFLAALDDREGAPCCFVLPRRGEMARLAATVYGLSVFRREFNALAREYADQTFEEGQRVRVHPSRHVYEFRGFWPNQPDKFRLGTLDGSGSRTFPANDVLRLEPTKLVTPQGRLDTNILTPETTPLDEVLGIPIFGNLSLFRNRVLCLDEQTRFAEFAGDHRLQREDLEAVLSLAELLPFAWLRDGVAGSVPTFENWSTRYPRAEPLVAVTSSSERLAAFCGAVPKQTKVVIVNGLRVISNPQAFDDISASQRTVLFADHDDEERMKELEARGCRFWVFGEREFFSYSKSEESLHQKRGPFGSIVHRARNLARLCIQPASCESRPLDAIALTLEELRPQVEAEAETNPNGRLGRLVQRLWRMLNEAAAFCHEPSTVEGSRFSDELSGLRSELDAGSFWLSPATVTSLLNILDSFRSLFEVGSQLGLNKGIALRQAIEAANAATASQVAVLTRTEGQARSIEEWLFSTGLKVPVFSLATIPENASFDRLIVASWPGGEAFRRIVGKLITPDIIAVSYGFEARWLKQCQRRLSQRAALTPISTKEKTSLIGGGKTDLQWPESVETKPPSTNVSTETPTFDVWSYEQRLKSIRKGGRADAPAGATERAKYVSFVGESYAFLTPWHKVPVATRLLGAKQSGLKSLPERVVGDLKSGDLVVFPEGGQKAVIAQIADRLIGTSAPAVRKRSRLWREALLSSGLSPEQFLAQAVTYGHTRHILTIRNWFYDDAQIGPGEREDLDLIVVVTESVELDKSAAEVWEAISFLRSNHLGAGSVLRDAVLQQLREALPKIEENGSRIEVPNLGAAWVVQVDSIAPDFTEEPRSQVDRLLWDDR